MINVSQFVKCANYTFTSVVNDEIRLQFVQFEVIAVEQKNLFCSLAALPLGYAIKVLTWLCHKDAD